VSSRVGEVGGVVVSSGAGEVDRVSPDNRSDTEGACSSTLPEATADSAATVNRAKITSFMLLAQNASWGGRSVVVQCC
jgi:hypothetical protein